MHDLVIRNGLVVNGTGAPGFVADVAVEGDRIVAVVGAGGRTVGRGQVELDATGCVVTPGFIDTGTHYDGQVGWDPWLVGSSLLGVTTVLVGSDGVGVGATGRVGSVPVVDGLGGLAGHTGDVGWQWGSYEEYLAHLGGRSWTMDVAANVAHASVRAQVVGDRSEAVSDTELAAMCEVVDRAVRAGALGFTTSRVEGAGGGDHELVALVAAARSAGCTLLQVAAASTADPVAAAHEQVLLSQLAAAGVTVVLDASPTSRAPGRAREVVAWARSMSGHGLDVVARVPARPTGLVLSMRGPVHPFAMTATVRGLEGLGPDERLARLADTQVRAQVLDEHAERRRSVGWVLGGLTGGFAHMYPVTDPFAYRFAPGASVADAAAGLGADPAEVAYDYLVANQGAGMLFLALSGDEGAGLRDLVAGPGAVYSGSGAGLGLAGCCDASVAAASLALWSDRGRPDTVALEHLVHGHTLGAARCVGLFDRGLLAEGFLADVNVIDLGALGCSAPRFTGGHVGGGPVLTQRASGFRATVKSGKVTVLDDALTGEVPGHLVRRGAGERDEVRSRRRWRR